MSNLTELVQFLSCLRGVWSSNCLAFNDGRLYVVANLTVNNTTPCSSLQLNNYPMLSSVIKTSYQ